jgi:hypothetical protein
MRHVWSILLALVLAATVWLLCGAADGAALIGRARTADGFHTLTGLALLLSAGSAYAILVLLPISPAGPTLGGLGYLGLGLWALVDPTSYAAAWPSADLGRPGYGLALLLAVPLIGTALLMGRWEQPEPARSVTRPVVDIEEAGDGPLSWLVPVRMPETARPAAPRPVDDRLPDNGDEATIMFATAGPETTTDLAAITDQAGEATMVIRPPTAAAAVQVGDEETAEDVETTTVIAPPPPAESDEATVLIKPPASADESEATTLLPTLSEEAAPAETTKSIDPDLGADPATHIAPLPEPDETTAVRPMTVMSMERPPDEADTETTTMILPSPRRPQDN